ncbi:MAG: glycosyltransferase [Bacteroidales bacterium]
MKLLDGFSVIICCYNSEKRLPNTLAHLAKQTFSGEWELIIVDNNCTDNTVTVAQNEWKKYNHRVALRIISETQPGLSHARRAGILNAKYKYAIFCDDDNWLNENYLKIAYEIMESHPDVGLLGGQSKEVCEIEPPEWFDKVKHNYAIGKQADKSGYLKNRLILWGAGLVIRTHILANIYRNNINHLLEDRKGKKLSSGGDSEISFWFNFANYRLFYEEMLFFYHFIPAERLKYDYYISLIKEFEQANKIIYPYRSVIVISKYGLFRRVFVLFKISTKLLLSIFYPINKTLKEKYVNDLMCILPFIRSKVIKKILKQKNKIFLISNSHAKIS